MTRWLRVDRAWPKGDGWWDIWLACGHRFTVLHGPTNPTGEYAQCTHRCRDTEGK